jgi:hypothetical protein
MAFPTNPTNGQQANVNGVVYTWNSTLTAWTVTTSTGASLSVNQLSTTAAATIGSTLSAVGNVSGANVVTGGALFVNSGGAATAIVNSAGNTVGNIGSTGGWFNTLYATSSKALYADLAENYQADAEYAPGTVVAFGGEAEVTLSRDDADARIAGVVSTNPSYVMNAGLEGANVVTVALTGRVPTQVTGKISKGDLIVSAGNGKARAEANPTLGTVIGKALEDSDGDAVIEVVVGRS